MNPQSATTLYDFYGAQGQALPSVSARQGIAQQAGIQNYTGSAQQNTQLLGYLKSSYGGVSNNSSINTTPVNTTPDASSLSNTQPVVVPPAPQGTSQAANAAIGASQGALLGLQNANVANAKANYEQSQQQTQGLINTYLGKGEEQIKMEKEAGAPQLQALSNSLNNQYLTQGAAYNSQYNSILNNPNMTREQATQAIADLQQQHGYDLTNTAIQASIASTNYANAETIINHQIELKYAPIKDAIDYGVQFMNQNKDLLTQAQQEKFNAQLQVQQQTYDQGVYNDHLIKDTETQMLKDAASRPGVTPEILKAMGDVLARGGSIGDMAVASGGILIQGDYQPVQTGFDPNTGVPIYSSFNQKTGQMNVHNGGGILGTTGSSQTTITGSDGTQYQMGASTTMGAYASATQTQVNNISATAAKIQSTVGLVADATSAQAAIDTVAKGSPITGTMIMVAAQKYGVDPSTLIGVMQAETQLGTDGSVGAKQYNWGNVGNTDMKMKLGQSVPMPNAQAGVDAVAKNLAQRKVQSGQNDPAQSTPTQGLTLHQIAMQSIQKAPALLQPAMGVSNATGAVYIDSSKIPSSSYASFSAVASNYSAKTGIPILNADQVSIINGADEAIRNITDVIAPAWAKIAPTNLAGRIGFQFGSITGNLFNTDKNANVKTFISNKENLAQQIKALSQSAPKLGLLGTAESALPDISGYGFTGKPIDTRKIGDAKMQRTLDLLNQTIKTFLPAATPAVLPSTQPPTTGILNGVTYQIGVDGNYYPVTK